MYNNVLKRLKKLNATQQRQAMSTADNAFIRQFVIHIKRLKQTKLSTIARKHFENIKRQFVSLWIREIACQNAVPPSVNVEAAFLWFYHINSISFSGYQIHWFALGTKHLLFKFIFKESIMDLRVQRDRTMCVAGPTNSGKPSLVLNLLEHRNKISFVLYSVISLLSD